MTDEIGSRHGADSQPADQRKRHPLARSGFIEYDRVVFFSDAVFAIAITLLAVNLRVPHTGGTVSARQLREALPGIDGFCISFAVIAFFWIGHHGIFRYIVAADRTLIALNLFFLGTIAFLPYPTDLLSVSRSQTTAVVFYASCGALAGLAETAIWIYATRARTGLTDSSVAPVRTFYLLRIARVPTVFLVSIPIAFADPSLAQLMWLLIWPAGVVLNHFGPQVSPPEQFD